MRNISAAPISSETVFRKAEKDYGVTRRAVQWYATKGYIPKPRRQGRQAFFEPGIYDYIACIALCQKELHLSLVDSIEILRELAKTPKVLATVVAGLLHIKEEYPEQPGKKLPRLVRMKMAMELVGWGAHKTLKCVDPDTIAKELRDYYGRFRREDL